MRILTIKVECGKFSRSHYNGYLNRNHRKPLLGLDKVVSVVKNEIIWTSGKVCELFSINNEVLTIFPSIKTNIKTYSLSHVLPIVLDQNVGLIYLCKNTFKVLSPGKIGPSLNGKANTKTCDYNRRVSTEDRKLRLEHGKVTNERSVTKKVFEGVRNKSGKHIVDLDLLKLCGDIHPNPGPSKRMLIGTYNVRGASDRNKLKRLLNYAAQNCKSYDRFIYSLQETHLTEKRRSEIQYGWRGEFVLSPGESNSRGVLTLFSTNFFSRILYSVGVGDPNGRATWVIGEFCGFIQLFVSVYAPNSGRNAEFYTSLTHKIVVLSKQYNVSHVYVSGDLNIDLSANITCKKMKKLANSVKKDLKKVGIVEISDKYIPTWNHGNKFSCLDYILTNKHLAKLCKSYKTQWGIDKSDHAAVECVLDLEIKKGPGLFRPDTSFLDVPELCSQFRLELNEAANQLLNEWDPHNRLEYLKMSIRTLLGEYSKRFINEVNRNLSLTRLEINKIQDLRIKMFAPSF